MAPSRRCVFAVLLTLALAGTVACDPPDERPRGAPASVPPAASAIATAASTSTVFQARERECDAGNDRACEKLTEMFLTGRGAPKSDEQAAALNERLCTGGRLYFCPTFAMVLAEGRGVEKDRARARELFERTCQHDPVACAEYGHLYLNGTGVAPDPELGRFLVERACQYGEPRACADLRGL